MVPAEGAEGLRCIASQAALPCGRCRRRFFATGPGWEREHRDELNSTHGNGMAHVKDTTVQRGKGGGRGEGWRGQFGRGRGSWTRLERVWGGLQEKLSQHASWQVRVYALVWGFRKKLFTFPVPSHWGTVLLLGESGTVVPLLASAAFAPPFWGGGPEPPCTHPPTQTILEPKLGCSHPLPRQSSASPRPALKLRHTLPFRHQPRGGDAEFGFGTPLPRVTPPSCY